MKKVFSFIVVACFILTSCAPSYIQVLSVTQAPDSESAVKDDNGKLVYEDSNCKIIYDLWSKGGDLSFVFENTSDNDLYLVTGKSFFIKNGHAYDYNGAFMSSSIDDGSSMGIHTSYEIEDGSDPKNDKIVPNGGIICIPARSYKIINSFPIFEKRIKLCEDDKNNYPKKESVHTYYTQEDSPLVFENRISYSTSESLSDLNKVNTTFYISEFVNYRYAEEVAYDHYHYNKCGKRVSFYGESIIVGGGPNQFYVMYQEQ